LVGAEGLWSKAQKDGIYQLEKYYRTMKEGDYIAFSQLLAVPLGDHKARLELSKANSDVEVTREGFKEGGVHPDDIDGIIKLLRRFHNVDYLSRAIGIWAQGDSLLLNLISLGEEIHREINSGHPSKQKLDSIFAQIDPLNRQLTTLENRFSSTLGEGSRWLENIILSLVFTVALIVEITGLLLSIYVARSMTKGLNAIVNATIKVSQGDLNSRATVYSSDEIGQVAKSVNQMAELLISSNEELGQFAYVASHDLQEPLRTICNYSSLLQKKASHSLDENGARYLASIERAAQRMQSLIKDLLDYSTIGYVKTKNDIDCNLLIKEIMTDMESLIEQTHTLIEFHNLPVIKASQDIKMLFQNLISNSIKFRHAHIPPVIKIEATNYEGEWLFSVRDNGIGIEEVYYERIFTIFQKLHSNIDYQGTGIGLAQCKKIVELHGGEIRASSEFGKGTTFYFSINKNVSI